MKTVFVSTDLKTHLVFSVSTFDTVADLKKKILLEHPICFPEVGKIEIHSIKIMGSFYNLTDSLYLEHGIIERNWKPHLYLKASKVTSNPNTFACLPFIGKSCKGKGKVCDAKPAEKI